MIPESRTTLRGALLFLLAVCVYLPSFGAGIVWNDPSFVFDNPLIHAPDGLWKFWFSTEPPDYFPLTSTTLWIEHRLWGGDPAGYHATNIALHAASCVLLWRVFAALRLPGAWIAAAVFAVHPVNVESVTWITQRKNVLPMFFYAASALAYLRADERFREGEASGRAYVASLALFVLALLSKTSVVVLPVALGLVAWWRRGRVDGRDVRRLAPFFALALVLGLVTMWYQRHSAIGDHVVREDGLLSRVAIAGRAAWFYLGKALLPIDLSFVYPRWPLGRVSAAAFAPLAALAAVFGVLFVFPRGWGRPLLFALGYWLVGLLPILGLVNIYFMRYSLVADHWQYTSLVGIAALVAAGLVRGCERLAGRELVAPAAAVLVGALGFLTWQQQGAYRDIDALWSDTLRENPSAWIAHAERGGVLFAAGRLPEAVHEYRAALAIDPALPDVHLSLATTLLRSRQTAAAEEHYRACIDLDPGSAGARLGLGKLLWTTGRVTDAIAEFETALELDDSLPEAHNALGTVLLEQGRAEEALSKFDRALELDPSSARAALNRGMALGDLGRFGEAIAEFERVLAADPRNAEAASLLDSVRAATRG